MWSTPVARTGVRTSIRAVRLMAVTIVGGVLLVAGVAALVLPGPGMLLCILGLIVLASEYVWAQRSLHWARRKSQQSIERGASSRLATYASVVGGFGLLVVGVVELIVGVPWVTSLSAAMFLVSGSVIIGTTAWSRRQYVRAPDDSAPPLHPQRSRQG
ncbi:MAG: hypothetical protein QOE24_664 [Frankiales bacterium]|jgi:uncharacterized protein (TIGR02611 family)|nr:hypothetical protein [Frankiales bacterium]